RHRRQGQERQLPVYSTHQNQAQEKHHTGGERHPVGMAQEPLNGLQVTGCPRHQVTHTLPLEERQRQRHQVLNVGEPNVAFYISGHRHQMPTHACRHDPLNHGQSSEYQRIKYQTIRNTVDNSIRRSTTLPSGIETAFGRVDPPLQKKWYNGGYDLCTEEKQQTEDDTPSVGLEVE
ncbi:uncharacterized protein METZ01_LOCUS330768, partial [marine metagenome]